MCAILVLISVQTMLPSTIPHVTPKLSFLTSQQSPKGPPTTLHSGMQQSAELPQLGGVIVFPHIIPVAQSESAPHPTGPWVTNKNLNCILLKQGPMLAVSKVPCIALSF